MIRWIINCILVVLIGVIGTPVLANEADRARIQLLEKTRNVDRGAWRALLSHESSDIRTRAMMSLGRVGDPKISSLVKEAIDDPDPLFRAAAAFAYGQLSNLSAPPLLSRLGQEKDSTVRVALIHAVGHRGNTTDIDPLLAILEGTSTEEQAAGLTALAHIVRRHGSASDALNARWSKDGFEQADPAIRAAWADGLAIAPTKGCETRKASLDACAKDSLGEIRAHCAKGTVCLEDGTSLRTTLMADSDWRVRAATARAMGDAQDTLNIDGGLRAYLPLLSPEAAPLDGTHFKVLSTLISSALSSPNDPVINRTAQALLTAATPVDEQPSVLPPEHRCGLSALVDRGAKTLRRTKGCGGPEHPMERRTPWLVAAMSSQSPQQKSRRLRRLYEQSDVRGQVILLEALGELPQTKAIQDHLISALASPEVPVVLTAIRVLSTHQVDTLDDHLRTTYEIHLAKRNHSVVRGVFDSWAERGVEGSEEIIRGHLRDAHLGVRRSAKEAIRAIKRAARARAIREGKPPRRRLSRRRGVPPPNTLLGSGPDLRLARPSRFSGARIHTSLGVIQVTLFKDVALNTVKHFTRLVEKGIYDGQPFHSAIAGHHIRIGDPTETGLGGFDPSIPCEINPLKFARGSVGFYHLGRDGGGRQLVITQRATPEFDGRFTLFAQATNGHEILGRLQPGDTILKVELISAP